MKLKEYLENLNKLATDRPELLDLDVVYAKDDEGNGYERVYYKPAVGHFDSDRDFTSESTQIENISDGYAGDVIINSVCIN